MRINQQPFSEAKRDRVFWYGGAGFVSHVWGLLGLKRIEVSVKIHPKIEAGRFKNDSQNRKQLSQVCYETISGHIVEKSLPAVYTPSGSHDSCLRATGIS
jgi:hypothetical protein